MDCTQNSNCLLFCPLPSSSFSLRHYELLSTSFAITTQRKEGNVFTWYVASRIYTVFENDQKCLTWIFTACQIFGKLLKMSHLNVSILIFSINICPIKIDLSCNTVWPQASGFSNTCPIFGIFDQLLATQNVKVARIAHNLECDFFCDFQTLCMYMYIL